MTQEGGVYLHTLEVLAYMSPPSPIMSHQEVRWVVRTSAPLLHPLQSIRLVRNGMEGLRKKVRLYEERSDEHSVLNIACSISTVASLLPNNQYLALQFYHGSLSRHRARAWYRHRNLHHPDSCEIVHKRNMLHMSTRNLP